MKAIIQERYGPPDDLELRDVARPTCGDDQVLVRVRAASVHPDVWHAVVGQPYILRLMGGGFSRPKNPTPGTDMAGVVESVGKQVTRFRAGDEVFGETIDPDTWANGGAFGEYVPVPQDYLALKPANITFEQAASVPTAGFITLLNFPQSILARPGHRVLINGAGGGVGAIALQLAKAHSAHVTAVDTTSKLPMLRSLGADEVIDYTREDFTQGAARYDLIFDVPGNHSFSVCKRALQPDGKYVLIGHESFGASGKRIFGLIPQFLRMMLLARFAGQLGSGDSMKPSKGEAIAVLRDLLEAGKITPIIDSTYPLSETREAMRHMIEDELQGKVIISV